MGEVASKDRAALLALAIEGWRFHRLFARALEKLDAGDSLRFVNQHRFFIRRIDETLEEIGLRLVNLENQSYDSGSAVKALNLEEFAPGDELVVEQMVEPIVMSEDGLVRQGTVLLRKV